MIAFVGAEATGKSTMLEETERWLGGRFTVKRVHVGKPPSTLLTLLPNLLLPLLRSLIPNQRSTTVGSLDRREPDEQKTSKSAPLMFAIRSVLLAYDRRALLTQAFADSANGVIVLCDRYPSADIGAPDSPQLGRFTASLTRHPFKRWLTKLEARIYADIPVPDLIIYLTAPLEVTLERNRARQKTENEEYVRRRHAGSSNRRFDERIQVYKVDSSQSLDDFKREVKQLIWRNL
jgi:thymidylate kinase